MSGTFAQEPPPPPPEKVTDTNQLVVTKDKNGLGGGISANNVSTNGITMGNTTATGIATSQTSPSASDSLLTTQGYVDKQVNGVTSSANTYTDNKATQTLNTANTYTDTQIAGVNGRINGIQNQVNDVARTAYSGIAGAAALSQLQIAPGKDFAIGIGAANYRGYSAGAVGIAARINENLQVKGGYTTNGIAAGGLSYSW